MSEPRVPHLLDDESAEASDLVRSALRGARADVPDAAHVDALSKSIAAAIGALPAPPGGGGDPSGGGGGGASGGAGAGAAPAASAAGGLGGAKLAIAGLATAVAVGVAVVATRGSDADRLSVSAPASSSWGPTAPLVRSAHEPPPLPPPSAGSAFALHANAADSGRASASPVFDVHALPSASAKVPPAGAAPAASASSEAEMTLLRSAQTALAASPSDALAKCEEHARAYPAGALAEEREVLAVDALLRLGRRAEAEKRADRFRAAHPGSAYLRRLDTLLGKSP